VTTVYIVSSGCKFEGGSVDAVFSSPTLACLHAEKMVAAKQAYVEESNAELRETIERWKRGENNNYDGWASADEVYEGCKLDTWAVEDKSEGGARCVASWGTPTDYVIVSEWPVDSVQP
jgi:hypothetical protein